MADNRSWRSRSRSYNESAILLVRRCVAGLRRAGQNTESALRLLAPELCSTHKRMRTLFYEDGTPIVTEFEWNILRRRYARFFLNLQIKHLELAEQCEAEANAPLLDEQLSFCWEQEICNENSGPRGRIASSRR